MMPKPQAFKKKPIMRRRNTVMTVCIAAIAADSKAIVCIADRALTYAGFGANAETDSGVTKIVDLPGVNWCAMFSGDDLTFPKRVLDKVFAALSAERNGSLAFIESTVKMAFELCWEQEIEDQILKPNLLTKDDFVNRSTNVQPLDTKLVMKIAEEISLYKQNCAMLFAGFDNDKAHIFMASTPERIDPCDWQGFAVVGAGTDAARNQIIWQEYEKSDSLQSVLYDVFCAKVATEMIQGVGYAWDWRVLVAGKKPKPLPKKIDSLIDKLWTTHNRSPFSRKLTKSELAPEGWEKILEEFAAETLASTKPKPKRSNARKKAGQQ